MDINFHDDSCDHSCDGSCDSSFPSEEDIALAKAFEEEEEIRELQKGSLGDDLGFAQFMAQHKVSIAEDLEFQQMAEELNQTLPPSIKREDYIDMYIALARLIKAMDESRRQLQSELIFHKFHDESFVGKLLSNEQYLNDFYRSLFK